MMAIVLMAEPQPVLSVTVSWWSIGFASGLLLHIYLYTRSLFLSIAHIVLYRDFVLFPFVQGNNLSLSDPSELFFALSSESPTTPCMTLSLLPGREAILYIHLLLRRPSSPSETSSTSESLTTPQRAWGRDACSSHPCSLSLFMCASTF